MLSVTLFSLVMVTRLVLLSITAYSFVQSVRLATVTRPVIRWKAIFTALWSLIWFCAYLLVILSGTLVIADTMRPVLTIGMACALGGWAWIAHDIIKAKQSEHQLVAIGERIQKLAEDEDIPHHQEAS